MSPRIQQWPRAEAEESTGQKICHRLNGIHIDIFLISNNCFLFYRIHSLIIVIMFVLLCSQSVRCFTAQALYYIPDIYLNFVRMFLEYSWISLTLLFFPFLDMHCSRPCEVMQKLQNQEPSSLPKSLNFICLHSISLQEIFVEKIGFLYNLKRLTHVKLSVFPQKR